MENDQKEIDLNVLNNIDVDSLSQNLKDQNEVNFVDINGNIGDNNENDGNQESMVQEPDELEKMIIKEKNGLNTENKYSIKIHQINDVGDIIKKVKMTNKIKKAIKKNRKKAKEDETNKEKNITSNNIDNTIGKNSN